MISGLLCLTLLALLLQVAEVAAAYRSYYYGYGYSGYTYTYTSYYYFPVGGIVGAVIGVLGFIGFVVGIVIFLCCVRKRRLAASRRQGPVSIALGAPIPAVSGPDGSGANYPKQEGPPPAGGFVGSLPPPYPGPNGQINNGFQQPQMPQGGYYQNEQPQYQQQQQTPAYPAPQGQPGEAQRF